MNISTHLRVPTRVHVRLVFIEPLLTFLVTMHKQIIRIQGLPCFELLRGIKLVCKTKYTRQYRSHRLEKADSHDQVS